MSDELPTLLLMACMVAACFAHLYAWQRLASWERIPLMVFSGSYLLTSAIGATALGLGGIEYLEEVFYGINTAPIRGLGNCSYWLLVYLPLIIPPIIAAQFASGSKTPELGRPLLPADCCYPSAYIIVLAAVAAYCIGSTSASGFSLALGSWKRLAGEFRELMILRSHIRDSVGFIFLSLVYVGLPVLSFAALYQFRKHGRVLWLFLFAITFILASLLGLATIQKSLLLVYLVAVCVAVAELGLVGRKHFLTGGIVGCIALTIMQRQFTGNWGIVDSLREITHRMGISFPYYADAYPDLFPFQGLDLGLWLIGLGSPPTDNIDVFQAMWPDVVHVVGHAAAPAHLRLYSQCGMAGAIGSLIVIGLGIGLVTRARRHIAGPLSFALYTQAIVLIYYATQIGLIDLIVSGYGMLWCVPTLFPVWLWAVMAQAGRRPAGQCASGGSPAWPRPARGGEAIAVGRNQQR